MGHLNLLHQLADFADELANAYFGDQGLIVDFKADLSPVSQADLAIEKKIRAFITDHHPQYAILGEEFGSCPTKAPLKIIIDPIDGTRNFVRGIPWFATLLAVEHNGEIVAGIVSAPIMNRRWAAQKGQGATCNNTPISVSSITTIAESQAFHGSLWGNEAATVPIQNVITLLSQTQRQRGVGDFLSHVLVAAGSGEFSLDFGLKPWDIAALKIIIEEAGGLVTNTDGGFSLYNNTLICSNGHLHKNLLSHF